MNQEFATWNNQHHFYLLRGLLVCNICGRTLVGRTAQGRVYYACPNGGKNRAPDMLRHTRSVAGG